MSETRPAAFGPVHVCCGVSVSVGHDLYCDERPKPSLPLPEYPDEATLRSRREFNRRAGREVFATGEVVDEDEFAAGVIAEARAKAGMSLEGMDLAANALVSVVTDQAARVLAGELAAAEAEARAMLTGKVRAALESGLDGQFVDPADGESMQRAAEIAVSVFEQVLRNPPAREVQAAPLDGPWVSWGGDGVGP